MSWHPSIRGNALSALLLCGLATPAFAAALPNSAPRTQIVFEGADNYSDSRLSDGADWYRESVFNAMRTFLAQQADQMLPDGYTLKMTFTDIDFGYRAFRRSSGGFDAPEFEFTYSVTDPSGAVVRHGSEDLKHDMVVGNYRFSVSTSDLTTDIIQREKPMLKYWAVTALAGLKQR